MDCKAIKKPSERWLVIPVSILFSNPGSCFYYVLARWERLTVNNVFEGNVYFLDEFNNMGRNDNQFKDGMYPTFESPFAKLSWP